MAQTNQILLNVANTVVTKEHILEFLDIIVNNPYLSIINQALIYKQNPDAKVVCGRVAWEKQGRVVKDNVKPIVLYIPEIQLKEPPEEFKKDDITQVLNDDIIIYLKNGVYKNNYAAVVAYDYSNTEKKDNREKEEGEESILPTPLPNFKDNIIEITQVSTEFIDKESIDDKKYLYDKDSNTFYIADEYEDNEAEINSIFLELYIDYLFDTYNIKDICLKNAVRYIIFSRYQLPHNIKAPLFTKLNDRNEYDKIDFLTILNYISSSLIQGLEGYILTFNETAFMNNLLISTENDEFYALLQNVIESIDDDMLKDDLIRLQLKVERLVDGYLDDLFKERVDHAIYTYPYKPLHLDDTDYLREDRQAYLKFA